MFVFTFSINSTFYILYSNVSYFSKYCQKTSQAPKFDTFLAITLAQLDRFGPSSHCDLQFRLPFKGKKNIWNRFRFGRVMIKSSKMTYLTISRAPLVRNSSFSNLTFVLPLQNGEKKNFSISMSFTQVIVPADRQTDRRTDILFLADLASLGNDRRFPLTQRFGFALLQT